MKIFIWNFQGIRGGLIVSNLKEQVKLRTSDILVILKTKTRSHRYGLLKRQLGLEFSFVVEPHGLSGGLCMFWKHGHQVELVKYAEFYIEVVIHDDEKKVKWHLLAIYASTNERVHCGQWHTLNKKILRYTEPCIVVSDFSDILDSSEKAEATQGLSKVWQPSARFFQSLCSYTLALMGILLLGGTEGRVGSSK